MSKHALSLMVAVVALAGCTDQGPEPSAVDAQSSPDRFLTCAPQGDPPVELESATLQRIGNDVELTWTASDVPPATGSFAANVHSADGKTEYMLSVELVDGDTPSPGSTGINVVWAEPSKVVTATYPLTEMPEIGDTFTWSASLSFSDGDGSFSTCPAGGTPVPYP